MTHSLPETYTLSEWSPFRRPFELRVPDLDHFLTLLTQDPSVGVRYSFRIDTNLSQFDTNMWCNMRSCVFWYLKSHWNFIRIVQKLKDIVLLNSELEISSIETGKGTHNKSTEGLSINESKDFFVWSESKFQCDFDLV